jgi:AraC-like DNA-binding protein
MTIGCKSRNGPAVRTTPNLPCGSTSASAGKQALVPDLEIVDVPPESSFKIWSHGYPFRTVRWHFHPEYEIHLVTATTGRSFIGDYIGTFAPGNLVMTGPNLPHNWISDIPKGEVVAQRGIVIQFTRDFIAGCMAVMPELRSLETMLQHAGSGIEYAEGTGYALRPLFDALLNTAGPERVGHFFNLLAHLQNSGYRRLASEGFRPRPEIYSGDPINHVIDHVARNLCEELRETELAELSGFSPASFSRAFKKHTGLTFVRYVNQLRIGRACELLISTDDSVAEICFQVGFNNLSNFNRHFLAMKRLSPSVFRREHRENARSRLSAEPFACASAETFGDQIDTSRLNPMSVLRSQRAARAER